MNQDNPTILQDKVLNEPSIVGMGTSTEKSCQVYDQWSTNYEHDIRKWGYDMPEKVAALLQSQLTPQKQPLQILDAGAGDGLSGVGLQRAGLGAAHMTGIDISSQMLAIAEQRGCYDATKVVNLNEALPYAANAFDVVTCVGTLTYMDPNAGTLAEFVRVCKPGGLVCYTQRTDKLAAFGSQEDGMEQQGLWKTVHKLGPYPYLPGNPEFGKKVEVMIFLYRVTKST